MRSMNLFFRQYRWARSGALAMALVVASGFTPSWLGAQCQSGDLEFGLIKESPREPVGCFEDDTEYRLLVSGPSLAAYPLCLNEGSGYTILGPTSGGQQCLGSASGDQMFRIETAPQFGGAFTLTGLASCPGGATTFSVPSCGSLPNEPSCIERSTQLVAWYPFDESLGDVVFDDLASTVNASTEEGYPLSTVGRVTGSVLGALQFDGVDDLVTVPHRADLQMGFGPFTVEAWVKTTDTEGAIVGKRHLTSNGSLRDWVLMLHQGKLWFRFNTRNVSVAANVADGAWHHVALVFDATSPTVSGLFVDGQRRLTFDATSMSWPLSFTSPLQIGGLLNAEPSLGRQFFDGKIDELSLYGTALSDPEIQALADAEHLGKCKDIPAPPAVGLACEATGLSANVYDCEASVFGGQGDFDFDWQGSGPGTVTFNGSEAVVDARDTCEQLAGPYTVTVTVTDAFGSSAEASRLFRCEP